MKHSFRRVSVRQKKVNHYWIGLGSTIYCHISWCYAANLWVGSSLIGSFDLQGKYRRSSSSPVKSCWSLNCNTLGMLLRARVSTSVSLMRVNGPWWTQSPSYPTWQSSHPVDRPVNCEGIMTCQCCFSYQLIKKCVHPNYCDVKWLCIMISRFQCISAECYKIC